MHRHRTGRRLVAVGLVAAAASLVIAAAASAHARVSPPVVLSKTGQIFSLAVPTEEEGSTTTKIELTPPTGFSIDSFVPSPGWHREVESTGSGEDAVVTKVTWTGGSVPTGEDAFFQFLAQTGSTKTYTFGVRQTYSDGKVVDWNGLGELGHAVAHDQEPELDRRRELDAHDRRARARRDRRSCSASSRFSRGGALWHEASRAGCSRPRHGGGGARGACRRLGARRAPAARRPRRAAS